MQRGSRGEEDARRPAYWWRGVWDDSLGGLDCSFGASSPLTHTPNGQQVGDSDLQAISVAVSKARSPLGAVRVARARFRLAKYLAEQLPSPTCSALQSRALDSAAINLNVVPRSLPTLHNPSLYSLRHTARVMRSRLNFSGLAPDPVGAP